MIVRDFRPGTTGLGDAFDTPRPDAEGADLSAAATSNGWPMPDWGINGPGGDPKYGTDLSKGAVAGIVVGILVAIASIVAVIYAIIRHGRRRNKQRKQSLGGATLVGEDEAADRRKGSDATYVSYEMDDSSVKRKDFAGTQGGDIESQIAYTQSIPPNYTITSTPQKPPQPTSPDNRHPSQSIDQSPGGISVIYGQRQEVQS